jgi:hypothetical protein
VSVEFGQTPFEVVQTNVLMPEDNPFTDVEELFTAVKVPLPASKLHVPVPLVGLLAESVVVEAQIV